MLEDWELSRCRSQPKFVEHFNRHFEHRIEDSWWEGLRLPGFCCKKGFHKGCTWGFRRALCCFVRVLQVVVRIYIG